MSSPCVLYDSNGDAFHITKNYVRYGNRILDASFIATITVKKHKLLFNNFKQNTTMPVLTVPFKKESDARQALNKCQEFYESASCNPYYGENDEFCEVFLVDAYGGVMHVAPQFLKYRNRIVSTSDVRTAHVKGRRILINHFKSNLNVPTMCVHFADKNAAEHAINCIESILWNVPLDERPEPVMDDEVVVESTSKTMELLNKPADPAFLMFLTVGTAFLFSLTFLRLLVGGNEMSYNDELYISSKSRWRVLQQPCGVVIQQTQQIQDMQL
jgi:hypothetical protein